MQGSSQHGLFLAAAAVAIGGDGWDRHHSRFLLLSVLRVKFVTMHCGAPFGAVCVVVGWCCRSLTFDVVSELADSRTTVASADFARSDLTLVGLGCFKPSDNFRPITA